MNVKMNLRILTKNLAADSRIESPLKSILEPIESNPKAWELISYLNENLRSLLFGFNIRKDQCQLGKSWWLKITVLVKFFWALSRFFRYWQREIWPQNILYHRLVLIVRLSLCLIHRLPPKKYSVNYNKLNSTAHTSDFPFQLFIFKLR